MLCVFVGFYRSTEAYTGCCCLNLPPRVSCQVLFLAWAAHNVIKTFHKDFSKVKALSLLEEYKSVAIFRSRLAIEVRLGHLAAPRYKFSRIYC